MSAPRNIAEQIRVGFTAHDRRDYEGCVDAFSAVDDFQFGHLDSEQAREAASAYVDALWAKDDVEDASRVGGEIQPLELVGADWSSVRDALHRRCIVAGIDPSDYVNGTTDGWRRHKTSGRYEIPMLRAQRAELRAALQDPSYPGKERNGQQGFGPEPARYLAGIELHDQRRWEEACDVMEPYFVYIEENH